MSDGMDSIFGFGLSELTDDDIVKLVNARGRFLESGLKYQASIAEKRLLMGKVVLEDNPHGTTWRRV
jgi:cysteinyl-tRNA synthetase